MANNNYSIYEIAFAGLIHDIGKFYQRTYEKSNLTKDELTVVPYNIQKKYHSHLHSGYTYRFLNKYLGIKSEYGYAISMHHKEYDNELTTILKKADYIASSIDRSDKTILASEEESGNFITNRLSSIIGEVDFGKEKQIGSFELRELSKIGLPVYPFYPKDKLFSSNEYKYLFDKFINEIKKEVILQGNITKYTFDRIYALMKEYTTTIPASSVESPKSSVSLFDHSKLTSAIASCIYLNNDKSTNFYMVEFDISGIQKFIFKITESSSTKKEVAKSLRGRSTFVSLITSFVAYSILNEFNLTQSNILFNTGGGALLLLPKNIDTIDRLNSLIKKVQNDLYGMLNTELGFVYSYVDLNESELKSFKVEKAVTLKNNLELEKSRKYINIIDENFYIKQIYNKKICPMCDSILINFDKTKCHLCDMMVEISDLYTKADKLIVEYDFSDSHSNSPSIKFSHGKIIFHSNPEEIKFKLEKNDYCFIESINNSLIGDFKNSGSFVPIKNSQILNFKTISKELLGKNSISDKKLAILKMDVDNLGAIFAFGLKSKIDNSNDYIGYRSISKFVTLSRFFEIFFSIKLKEICVDISKTINPEISNLVDNETMFYINYAGGDDLVIIGPLEGIIHLSKEIQKQFNNFTLNKNISISGGISIQKPEQPIRFGISRAEEQLQLSKNNGKNKISILDVSLSFEEFEIILNTSQKYINYMIQEKPIISRSLLYELYNVLNSSGFTSFKQNIPIILYSLQRNVNSNYREIIKHDFLQLINNDSNYYNRFILMLKLSLILSREG